MAAFSFAPRNFNARASITTAVAAAALCAFAPASAAPYRPSDDGAVLATVSASSAANRNQLDARRKQLSTSPDDLAAALDLARLAILEGRASADPRRYGQAQAALRPWWSAVDAPPEVHVLRAVIRQSLHDFDGAEADLDAILAADPRSGQARLTRAFLRQTTGALDGAREDCRALPKAVGLTAAAVCGARVAALTGAAGPALERLERAMRLDAKADPQVRRWARAAAAEIAVMAGETAKADQFFAEALADGGDIPTLVGYADFLLDAGREAEALALLSDRGETDGALLRLAIAGRKLGDSRAAHWSALLSERFAAARAVGEQLHQREEARFELEVRGDAGKALGLALANWTLQKEPADARLVLRAAAAAGDPGAAVDVLRFIQATGLVDLRLEPLRGNLAEQRS